MIVCPKCKQSYQTTDFLNCLSDYVFDTDSAVFVCPKCETPVDVRVTDGQIEIGYVYGTGDRHFSGMITYDVIGLMREPCLNLLIDYESRKWEIKAPKSEVGPQDSLK